MHREQNLPSSSLLAAAAAKLLQSCPILCNPMDGSPPGSAIPGILQARKSYSISSIGFLTIDMMVI